MNIIDTVVFSVTLFELTVVNNWYIIMVSEPVHVYMESDHICIFHRRFLHFLLILMSSVIDNFTAYL